MGKLVASASLLVWPLTINAEPIVVDYEGVVDFLYSEEGSVPISGFEVGQRVKGLLTISTEHAGSDRYPGNNAFGRYEGGDFVRSEFDIALAGSSARGVV